MSYYCEMCGRELDSKTAKKAVVEGSLLILCQDCYARLSKTTTVREPPKQPPRTTPSVSAPKKQTRVVEELEIVDDYATRIKSARESLGWTQDVLAQKVGESVLTIKRIEGGKLKPSVELARRLERVLAIKLLEPVVKEDRYISINSGGSEHLTIGDLISIEEKPRKRA